MAKRKLQVPKSEEQRKKDFVEKAEPSKKEKPNYVPYSERKTKGRSIGMTDDFYQSVKDFVQEHPELGNVSIFTVRALSEFMDRYKK